MNVIIYYSRLLFQIVIFTLSKVILVRRAASWRMEPAGKPYLFASNHRSALDPFVVIAGLRYKDFFRCAPFSFMTANIYLKPWYTRSILRLSGCFPAKPGLGDYGVGKATSYLARGHSVLIFPEGKRVRPEESVSAKPGIIAIANSTAQASLVLIHIEWRSARNIRSIKFSYPHSADEFSSPDHLLSSIYAL